VDSDRRQVDEMSEQDNMNQCTELMDFTKCWIDWRSELKESVQSSRSYYKDETVQALIARLDNYLAKRVCASSPEEEVISSLWEAADPDERKTLATLFLKVADRI
jgi:hypothetical protein